ncbi:hypothetical protein [Sphingobacterium sp. GVS05A]|jgi:hypothetical protein|uniref:hypothetical protein n=1 Tax=Sphingobacterium TaxID=28453 RepID=UPI000F9BC1BE|nr:hypothetical protein [Sphingobacterium sp. GVS05A]
MKLIFIIIGGIFGVLFSFWDAMVSYSDTAPIDDQFGLAIISWPFFLIKTLIYLCIGSFLCWLISLVFRRKLPE